jgi:hypothetical protein
MGVITGSDMDDLPDPIATYRGDQLAYMPYLERSWTPYGFPGIERALLPAITGIKRQAWQLEFFTQGSIPGLFVTPGPEVSTPAQVLQLQETLNALAGDTGFKHQIIVLPGGSNVFPQKPYDLASMFDETLFHEIAMAYEVMPTELGISPRMSTLGATQATHKGDQQVHDRKATKPLLAFLKTSLFDWAIQELFSQDDMEWKWLDEDAEEAEQKQVATIGEKISMGLVTIDEGRAELGLEPYGAPLTSDPILITGQVVTPLASIQPDTEGTILGDETQADPQPTSTVPPNPDDPDEPDQGAPAKPPAPKNPEPGTPSAQASQGAKPAGERPAAKTAEAEVAALRRYLKRGKPLAKFRPDAVTPAVMLRAYLHADPGDDLDGFIVKLRGAARAQDRRDARRAAVAGIATSVASRARVAADAAGAVAAGDATAEQAAEPLEDTLIGILQDGYEQAARAGSDYASYRYDIDGLTDEQVQQIAAKRATEQRPYVQGLLDDINAGVPRQGAAQILDRGQLMDALQARISLYAQSANQAYEDGVQDSVTGADPDASATWNALGDNPCPECEDLDGQTFQSADVPDFPHPNCECEVDWDVNTDVEQIMKAHPMGKAGLEWANYRAATGTERCRNCEWLKGESCTMFATHRHPADVKADYTCDKWEGEKK